MNRARYIWIIGSLVMMTGPIYAQSSEKESARGALRALVDHYKRFPALSFDIDYRFSSEAQPDRFLDSLHGRFALSGDRYRYILDSNVYVGDSQLSVVLFKNDRIIYLTRARAGATMQNPMTIIDSMLLRGDSVEAHVTEYPDGQKITLAFTGNPAIKRIEYYIGRSSGLLAKMRYVVPAKDMYDPSARPLVSQEEVYAIIETDFSHYRELPLENGDFDLGRYVKKENGQYVTVAPYEHYKLFRGSPDLP